MSQRRGFPLSWPRRKSGKIKYMQSKMTEIKEADQINTQKQTSAALTEKPTTIEIDIVNGLNILHKLNILPAKKEFVIRPITLCALGQISEILLDINFAPDDSRTVFDVTIEQIAKNKDKMVKIAAYAIENRRGEPDPKLINFLDENLTASDLLLIFNVVTRHMNAQDFFYSMVLASRINILQGQKKANTPISGKQ